MSPQFSSNLDVLLPIASGMQGQGAANLQRKIATVALRQAENSGGDTPVILPNGGFASSSQRRNVSLLASAFDGAKYSHDGRKWPMSGYVGLDKYDMLAVVTLQVS